MSLANNIAEINASAKKLHGQDITIVVARAVAFGNEDNLVIISGKNHRAAAADFGQAIPNPKITEEFHPEMNWGDGEVTAAYTTTLVAF